MPSGSRRGRRVARSNPGFSRPTTPHFVKLVLSSSIQRGKMQIPPQFVRKYLHNFADSVELKVPNDDVWSVKLELYEGKLWLGEGWRKFQDRYRLKEGSLLLFHLEGNAVFQVLVFNRSCSEIDYPVKITPGVRTQTDSISSESEDDSNDSLESDYSSSADYMPSGSRRSRRGVGTNVGFFRPKNPHFVKVVLPKSLSRGKIQIPPRFSRKYGDRFSEAIELKVPTHDAWLVKVKLSEGKVWLGKGWRKFQEHYLLETGSYLLFQLGGNSAFQVLIFDRSGTEIDYPPKKSPRIRPEPSNHFIPSEVENDSSESEGTSRRRPRRSAGKRKPQCFRAPLPPGSQEALEAAKRFNTNGFSFHIQMRKCNMRSGGVSISKKNMYAANIDVGSHRVELRHDGEAWPVNMICYKDQGTYGRGWLDFLKGNDVDAGDVCVFELVETNVFDVHIFKRPLDS